MLDDMRIPLFFALVVVSVHLVRRGVVLRVVGMRLLRIRDVRIGLQVFADVDVRRGLLQTVLDHFFQNVLLFAKVLIQLLNVEINGIVIAGIRGVLHLNDLLLLVDEALAAVGFFDHQLQLLLTHPFSYLV